MSIIPTGLTHFGIEILQETITFSPSDWNSGKTVGINVIQDDVDSPVDLEQLVLMHRATGGDYGVDQHYPQADFSVSVTGDDDTRSLSMVADRTEGKEGESFIFRVRLTSEPTDDVTLMLAAESDRFVVAPSTFELDFTSGNWQVLQTVAVMVEGDDVDTEDGELKLLLTSARGASDYRLLPGGTISPTVTVRDNDSRSIEVVRSGLRPEMREAGGSNRGFYTLVLESEPTDNVEVRVILSGLRLYKVEADPALVTFTPVNWRTPQRINIAVLDNDVDASPDNEMETLQITHRVTGGDYEGRGLERFINRGPVTVTGDDDTRGLSMAADRPEGEEGETFRFSVRLTSEPTEDVTLTLTAESDNFELSQSAFELNFTPGDWQDLQTVEVMVEDDDLHSGYGVLALFFTGASGASDYRFLPGGAASVAVTVRDNEEPPVLRLTLTPSEAVEGSTDGSDRKTVRVRLRAGFEGAARSEDTVFSLSISGASDTAVTGVDYIVPADAPTQLTIAAGQKFRDIDFNLLLVQDRFDEGEAETLSITASQAVVGGGQVALAGAVAVFTIEDDDSAGVELSLMGQTVHEGDGVTWTVALSSQPTADVNVAVSVTPPDRRHPACHHGGSDFPELHGCKLVHPADGGAHCA